MLHAHIHRLFDFETLQGWHSGRLALGLCLSSSHHRGRAGLHRPLLHLSILHEEGE